MYNNSLNKAFSATNIPLCLHKNTDSYMAALALLILNWINKKTPSGILRLSLIHKRWVHTTPSKFTRTDIKNAIKLLDRNHYITICPKDDDLLLISTDTKYLPKQTKQASLF